MKKLINDHGCQWINSITENTEVYAPDPAEIFILMQNEEVKLKSHRKNYKSKTVKKKRETFDIKDCL